MGPRKRPPPGKDIFNVLGDSKSKDIKKESKNHKNSKDSKKHPKSSSHGKRYGASGGYKGVNVKDAKKLVNAQIRPDIRKAKHEKKQVRRDYRNNVAGIKKIAEETQNYINNNNSIINAGYNNAKSETAATDSAAISSITGRSNSIKSSANSELARLGISDPNALNSLDNNTQNALNIASITGANNQANLAALQGNANSIGQLMLGMNRGIRDSGLAQARNDRRDALAEATEAIRGARGARSGLMLQTLQQLQQTGWQQYMDMQNLKLSRKELALKAQAAAASAASGGSGGPSGSGSGSSGSGGTKYTPSIGFLENNLLGGGNKKPKKSKKPAGWGKGLGVSLPGFRNW